jgi:rRNA maturation endonuclease Nob1
MILKLGKIRIEVAYKYKKKCQRCKKMYGTDFKTSKYCYSCSEYNQHAQRKDSE